MAGLSIVAAILAISGITLWAITYQIEMHKWDHQ